MNCSDAFPAVFPMHLNGESATFALQLHFEDTLIALSKRHIIQVEYKFYAENFLHTKKWEILLSFAEREML